MSGQAFVGKEWKKVGEHRKTCPGAEKVGITKLRPHVTELRPSEGVWLSRLFMVRFGKLFGFIALWVMESLKRGSSP